MKYMLVTGVIGALSMYDLIFVMTQGGPNKKTYTVTYYVFVTSFQNYNFGYGCAMALVFFIECVVIAVLMDKITDSDNIEF
jgi:ABC-type sugar transport system permease subunit